jgi:REP element-mobilizing transposase RayT
MPNTYTQIYIHVIFAVHGRENLIDLSHKNELEKYMTGIIARKEQKLYAISCMPDHIHFFISMQPTIGLSDLVRDVKNNTTRFINQKNWMTKKFRWQKGFGAFSYGHSQIDRVVKYLHNQEGHHSQKKFREEYMEMLDKFQVSYENKYLFDWINN